jgi:hypothetical protein
MTTDRAPRLGLRAGLLALLGLAGCEDVYTITRVDRIGSFARSHVVSMAAGGLPTEIHGAPFTGLTPAEIAARLRGPQAYPDALRFRAIEPGALPAGSNRRLVLVFNRAGNPDGMADCRATAPIATATPRDRGFTVTATFCSGDRMNATAHMDAESVRADDPDAFTRVMRLLFRKLFP